MAEIESNLELKDYCSWKVGGVSEYAVFPETVAELGEAVVIAHKNSWPITVLGQGTNVLISDRGISGLTILTQKLNKITVHKDADRIFFECGSGVPKAEVLKVFIKEKLAPAVFLAGLPGDVGGGVVMNAGVSTDTEPKEFYSLVDWLEVVRLKGEGYSVERISSDNLTWHYRKSEGWQPGIIARVGMSWTLERDDEVLAEVRKGNARRKSTQPLTQPSCGSVFKNPDGDKSGRLIEASGLKGFQIGGAQVSDKHANFIVNLGEATATDIDQVIKHIQAVVNEKHGIMLTNEVCYLGQW